MSLRAKAYGWLDERVDLAGVKHALAAHRVPIHRWSIFNVLGAVTLGLLLIQVATGALLLLHYRPSAGEAHRSVATIMAEVPFGDLIRSVHAWTGDLFVGSLLAHVFTAVIQRAYRAPRELLWFTGSVLLVLGVGVAFSGHLLPWTAEAYAAARVSSELAAGIPFFGSFCKVFLRGGDEITAASLQRFFGFHVAIMPPVLTVVLALHLWFGRRQGLSIPRSIKQQDVRTVPYWPNIFVRDLALGTALFIVVLSLAVLWPRQLGAQADPLAPSPPEVKAEWYFQWAYQLVRSCPPKVLGVEGPKVVVSGLLVALALFVGLPLIDRKGSRSMFYVGWSALIAFVGVTLYGLL